MERLKDVLLVFLALHVDEIDDDDSAKVAQPDLPDDFFGGLDVDLGDGVFEISLADILPGVHVDGHERFGLVHDDVATALQPNLGMQCLFDLILDACTPRRSETASRKA